MRDRVLAQRLLRPNVANRHLQRTYEVKACVGKGWQPTAAKLYRPVEVFNCVSWSSVLSQAWPEQCKIYTTVKVFQHVQMPFAPLMYLYFECLPSHPWCLQYSRTKRPQSSLRHCGLRHSVLAWKFILNRLTSSSVCQSSMILISWVPVHGYTFTCMQWHLSKGMISYHLDLIPSADPKNHLRQ